MQNSKLTQYGRYFFSVIVLTHLRNDLYAFKINLSDTLFYSSSIAVLSDLDWKLHLFYFLKRPYTRWNDKIVALEKTTWFHFRLMKTGFLFLVQTIY